MRLSLVLLVLAVACGGGASKPTDGPEVTGSVTYRQRIALPSNAEVIVTLLDVSRADAQATELGREVIGTGGTQVPFAFSIPYAADAIDPRGRYALRAEIREGEHLLFTSTRAYPVLTQGAGAGPVEIVVESASPQP